MIKVSVDDVTVGIVETFEPCADVRERAYELPPAPSAYVLRRLPAFEEHYEVVGGQVIVERDPS